MKLSVDLINPSREKRGKGKREKRGAGRCRGRGVRGGGGNQERENHPSKAKRQSQEIRR